jgi:hypothetical protein
MAIEFSYVPDDELIVITCRGRITFGEIEEATMQGCRLAAQYRVSRFLADARDTESSVGSHEIYDLPELYASAGISRSTMIAVVAQPDGKNFEDFRFFETVCRNNGYHYVETFNTVEDARAWLTRPRPSGYPTG